MSKYRRFFSYIYAYEQKQKTSNAGFAKIEMKGPLTTIELHMRRTLLSAPIACLYLFARTDDSIQGFALGDVPFSGGNADWRFTLNQTQLADSPYSVSDAAGILFMVDDAICFVSQWDEAPIDWESFHIYQTKEEETSTAPVQETPAPEPETQNRSPKENVIQTAELPLPQPKTTVIPADMFAAYSAEKKSLSSINRDYEPKTWQGLLDARPHLQPFSNPDIQCVKIELKDLRLLPPANWHLCNNSFLLHAFFTYRHLIFGSIPSTKGHKWFIGVPGIRYRQEHVMAAIFGFSDFLPDKESSDAEAPFGYWYISMVESD